MYVDKLNNKISEEMYERLFEKLKNEIKELNYKLENKEMAEENDMEF